MTGEPLGVRARSAERTAASSGVTRVAVVAGAAAAISWWSGIWWLFCVAVTVAAAGLWFRHRALSEHLLDQVTAPPDPLLNRFAHPFVLLGGPPALVLSWELSQSAVIDVAVLSALAVTWVTLRERYQSVPKELARRAVEGTQRELAEPASSPAEPLVQLCATAQWRPSVLDRATELVALVAPNPVEGTAKERIRQAAALATGGSA